jgi:hypothetical protein
LASSSLKTLAIHFGDLEFIADCSDDLNPSPEGGDSSAALGGMTYNGSPSVDGILEESPSEDDSISSEGESFDSPLLRACNTMMYAIPITITPLPEETPTFQTLPVRLQRTATPTPLLEQLMDRKEERQHIP